MIDLVYLHRDLVIELGTLCILPREILDALLRLFALYCSFQDDLGFNSHVFPRERWVVVERLTNRHG